MFRLHHDEITQRDGSVLVFATKEKSECIINGDLCYSVILINTIHLKVPLGTSGGAGQ